MSAGTDITTRDHRARRYLPDTAVLELTYRCNYSCLFCSCPWTAPDAAYDIRQELETPAWIRTIRALHGMGVVNLAFTGGEPLLRADLGELLESAAAIDPPVRLFLLTNGSLLSDTMLDLCARLGVHLGLSLPGLEMFEELTGGAAPEPVLHWIREASRIRVPVTVGITVTRRNLDELYETCAEALLAGADSLRINRFLPGGRGLAHVDELVLSAEETRQMLQVVEEALRDSGRHATTGTELPRCVFGDLQLRQLSVGSRCGAVHGFFAIDPSGYVRVCNHSTVRLGHVDEISSVHTHPYWKRFVRRDYLPESCEGCRDEGRCDGGCPEVAGSGCLRGGRPTARRQP